MPGKVSILDISSCYSNNMAMAIYILLIYFSRSVRKVGAPQKHLEGM